MVQLKRRIKTRTVNVHTHLFGVPRRIAPQPVDARAEAKPFDPRARVSEEDRTEFRQSRARLPYSTLKDFDSPDQEDAYVRKYVHSRGAQGRTPLESHTERALEENAVRLLRELDGAGIDTAVVLLLDITTPSPLNANQGDPGGERIEPMLSALAELCRRHPGRFVPFVAIDVRRGKQGVSLFEGAVKKYGFKGYGELLGTVWQTRPDDRSLCYPIFEKCVELGVPAMIDATMHFGFSDPEIYENILRDFPKLKVCAGGAGTAVKPVERAGKIIPASLRFLELAEKHENLYLDLDDWQWPDQKSIHSYLEYLSRAMKSPARNRIMFGSDYPVRAWMYTEKEWIDVILRQVDKNEFQLGENELARFFSLNALEYLGLKI